MAKSKKSGATPSTSAKAPSIDIEMIRQVIDLVEASEITELEWEDADARVRIRRGDATVRVMPTGHSVPVAVSAMPTPRPSMAPRPSVAPAAEKKGHIVSSPFVGTFYRTPAPDQPPYVEVGTMVKKGQVLCIVEAMKLMNEIESEVAGKLAEILVENGHPVEFGQALFRIENA